MCFIALSKEAATWPIMNLPRMPGDLYDVVVCQTGRGHRAMNSEVRSMRRGASRTVVGRMCVVEIDKHLNQLKDE